MHHDVVILRTARLLVRKLTMADLPAYKAVEGDPKVMRYITGRPRTAAESDKRLRDFIQNYAEHPFIGVWAVIENSSQQYIGTASIFSLEGCPFLQIGYKLTPWAQGKGYATEIAKALLHHAFFKVKLQKVVAVTDPHNTASQHVLLKAGMQRNGFHFAYDKYLFYFELEKAQYLEHLRKSK